MTLGPLPCCHKAPTTRSEGTLRTHKMNDDDVFGVLLYAPEQFRDDLSRICFSLTFAFFRFQLQCTSTGTFTQTSIDDMSIFCGILKCQKRANAKKLKKVAHFLWGDINTFLWEKKKDTMDSNNDNFTILHMQSNEMLDPFDNLLGKIQDVDKVTDTTSDVNRSQFVPRDHPVTSTSLDEDGYPYLSDETALEEDFDLLGHTPTEIVSGTIQKPTSPLARNSPVNFSVVTPPLSPESSPNEIHNEDVPTNNEPPPMLPNKSKTTKTTSKSTPSKKKDFNLLPLRGKPKSKHIRFGRGDCNTKSPGNKVFFSLILQYQSSYKSAVNDDNEKRRIIDAIKTHLQEMGMQFVIDVDKNGQWYIVPYEDKSVYNKIAQSLRDDHSKEGRREKRKRHVEKRGNRNNSSNSKRQKRGVHKYHVERHNTQLEDGQFMGQQQPYDDIGSFERQELEEQLRILHSKESKRRAFFEAV